MAKFFALTDGDSTRCAMSLATIAFTHSVTIEHDRLKVIFDQ